MSEDRRNAAGHNTMSEAFGDRRLADAWVTEKHRVILGASGEDPDHSVKLIGATDQRIESPLSG